MDDPITKKQIGKIWATGKKVLGMNSDEIYLLVFGVTGKDSISSLSKAEGIAVIEKMGSIISRAGRSPKVVRMVSREQKEKIQALASRINTHKVLVNPETMAQRMHGKRLGALNVQQAQSIIEAMKSILERNTSARI